MIGKQLTMTGPYCTSNRYPESTLPGSDFRDNYSSTDSHSDTCYSYTIYNLLMCRAVSHPNKKISDMRLSWLGPEPARMVI